MIKLIFICLSDNKKYEVETEGGQTLMEAAVAHKIPHIAAECGGACSCGTCHIYIDAFWQKIMPPLSAQEEDMLIFADKRQSSSRLACQIPITDDMDGLTVYVP